jgi:hypothetical protein
MRRFSASDIVLKGLSVRLSAAAVLKGHELLTVPVANKDLWSWRLGKNTRPLSALLVHVSAQHSHTWKERVFRRQHIRHPICCPKEVRSMTQSVDDP